MQMLFSASCSRGALRPSHPAPRSPPSPFLHCMVKPLPYQTELVVLGQKLAGLWKADEDSSPVRWEYQCWKDYYGCKVLAHEWWAHNSNTPQQPDRGRDSASKIHWNPRTYDALLREWLSLRSSMCSHAADRFRAALIHMAREEGPPSQGPARAIPELITLLGQPACPCPCPCSCAEGAAYPSKRPKLPPKRLSFRAWPSEIE